MLEYLLLLVALIRAAWPSPGFCTPTGFVILWLVPFSCDVKLAVQRELTRRTIAMDTPTLSGYTNVPPLLGPVAWINRCFVLLILSRVLQVGSIRTAHES